MSASIFEKNLSNLPGLHDWPDKYNTILYGRTLYIVHICLMLDTRCSCSAYPLSTSRNLLNFHTFNNLDSFAAQGKTRKKKFAFQINVSIFVQFFFPELITDMA